MTTPTPDNAPAPNQTADVQAAVDSAQDASLRQLAAQIAKMTASDPTAVVRKAIIASVVDDGVQPTVSLNISGDTETLVSQVCLLNNYTPLVGNTVLMVKQGSEIFILGAIAASNAYSVGNPADGWIRATLAAGSHGGNGNGDVYYRRVLDHGSWMMQWRGGWGASGTTLISALGADYRPSSTRTVLAARNTDGGSILVELNFNTSGSVTMDGGVVGPLYDTSTNSTGGESTSGASPGTDFIDPIDGTTGASAGTAHTHGVTGGHSHTVDNHWHGNGSHSHSGVHVYVNSPTWVSLNGVSYYL